MSVSALLACTSFYSALYLVYYFFIKVQNPLFLFLAVGLLIFACIITPYGYERQRSSYDRTMSFGQYLAVPLILWGRLFILPISLILSWLYSN
ncbi:hypothetical protein A3K93_08535 [Acinetobacter sp. NCu2D-2]|uniref:hypothetical protein n=1 Tax=Acinetobacter sp. NCu2D-2 TaxID=1608473 RepID=UPI0007CDC745|nr:hypothetical protein [Acinetobacter sp. NCu2D-2]ANF82239.1 hypothetical protein A3K93_08535 [Acinetobacter sp. NCu2D-2]